MNDILLLKPGELVLKGQNRHFFEDRLRSNVARRLKSLGRFQITSVQSTIYVEPLEDGIDLEEAFRMGVACAGARCMTEGYKGVDKTLYKAFLDMVKIERI